MLNARGTILKNINISLIVYFCQSKSSFIFNLINFLTQINFHFKKQVKQGPVSMESVALVRFCVSPKTGNQRVSKIGTV